MNEETIIPFLESVKDDDLILIYVFKEPHHFIKGITKYDINKSDNTLALLNKANDRVTLIDMDSIKSITSLSASEYDVYPTQNEVLI